MNKFTISPIKDYKSGKDFLKSEITGFYHADFGDVNQPDNPNFLYKFKFDPHHNWTDYRLQQSQLEFHNILLKELPLIHSEIGKNPLVICVVPRSKADKSYRPNQLLFKATIKNTVQKLNNGLIDGTDFIVRHINTKTTHLRKPMENFINDGSEPYPGISVDTCHFSSEIEGKDILLIDDIYTKTVNIDEDMIQALIDKRARSVSFYAIGKTASKGTITL